MARHIRSALARLGASIVMGFACVLGIITPAHAQSLIRDAEIEYALRELARPVISAAGLSPAQIRILMLDDSSLNAFVLDGQTIIVHTGLLLRLKRAEEVQAVLAHEVAHIANGHISRRAANFKSARTTAGLGMLLAIAVGVAGGAEAAGGIAIGTASSAQRVFLAHTRAEEASADQSGVRYMASAGIDPQAAADVLDIFRGQEALSVGRVDPYALSHPLSRERIRAMQGFATTFSGKGVENPEATYWFNRMQAKLEGFIRNPATTLRRAPASDTSDAALMRRAVALHRQAKTTAALAEIDALIARRPADAFAVEVKGQILLESRQFAAAAQTYARAVQLAPNQPLILGGHGRALLAEGSAASIKAALPVLEKAVARDGQDPRILRDLAVAYAKNGNPGMASLATAERYAILGRMKDAGVHARRAEGQLPRGSPGWRRAQDVIEAAQTAEKRSKN